jgi:hypothetical protein
MKREERIGSEKKNWGVKKKGNEEVLYSSEEKERQASMQTGTQWKRPTSKQTVDGT